MPDDSDPVLEPEVGLVDPRSIKPAPESLEPGPAGSGLDSNESPDEDPPAWEGPEPGSASPGIIDPRPDLPGPAGL